MIYGVFLKLIRGYWALWVIRFHDWRTVTVSLSTSRVVGSKNRNLVDGHSRLGLNPKPVSPKQNPSRALHPKPCGIY